MQPMQRDWQAVGGYLAAAMREIAADLGGEEFATQITDLAISDDVLPNPAALKMLEDSFPGSAERVLIRSSEIQRETHQQELAALRKPNLRRNGRVILEGFASLNISGSPAQKR